MLSSVVSVICPFQGGLCSVESKHAPPSNEPDSVGLPGGQARSSLSNLGGWRAPAVALRDQLEHVGIEVPCGMFHRVKGDGRRQQLLKHTHNVREWSRKELKHQLR